MHRSNSLLHPLLRPETGGMHALAHGSRDPGVIEADDRAHGDADVVDAINAHQQRLRSEPATSFQCLALRCELREQSYPERVGSVHSQVLKAAGVAWRDHAGQDIDTALRTLNREQAGALLRALNGGM